MQPRHFLHAALRLFLSICGTVCPVFVGCIAVCPVVVVRGTVCPVGAIDERLMLETSAFLPFTMANLRFQLSC